MALINCSECKKGISNVAKTCPNCGAPVDSLQNNLEGCGKSLHNLGCALTSFVTIPILIIMLLMFC